MATLKATTTTEAPYTDREGLKGTEGGEGAIARHKHEWYSKQLHVLTQPEHKTPYETPKSMAPERPLTSTGSNQTLPKLHLTT